ncbi:RraA family protein [Dactylosporangium sp. CA-233914]|uniref:RraA family protein n=1 Tax=Dactylosporangium sp. CA-233914 TaxID=3239934 RepID=UPI003D89F59D
MAFSPTDLSDVMQGACSMDAGIGPVYRPLRRFAGPAVTVAVPAGSVEVRRIAMDLAQPGDVLVVAAGAISAFAVLGGRLAERLKRQGLAGVVIDGHVRDVTEIEMTGLPVLCRGQSLRRPPATGPGEVNVAVACGGIVVSPGDVIVADADGAVAVPRAAAAGVLAAAREYEAA